MALDSAYFDSEKLIIEVEKRPGLYNKNLPEYSDRNAKEKLWVEVCEAIVPNWGELDKAERIKKGKDVQRKWKNMRDSFRKELNQQKTKRSGEGKQKRRKYLYFEQLLFLLPTVHERDTSGNYTPPEANSKEEEEGDEENDTNQETEASSSSASYNPRRVNQKKRKNPTYEESLLQILTDSNKPEDIDEDKSFLLSLLPSFKKLSAQQKLSIKMQFLQDLNQVMFPENNPSCVISHSGSQSLPMPNNVSVQLQTQQMKHQQTTFPSVGMPSTLSTQMLPRTQPVNRFLQIQTDPIPSTQITSNVGNYYCSFSPNSADSLQCNSPISPDNSILSTPDSELLELY